jgi:hypothetical protein
MVYGHLILQTSLHTVSSSGISGIQCIQNLFKKQRDYTPDCGRGSYSIFPVISIHTLNSMGEHESMVVEPLYYKLEDRRFENR